VKLGKLKDISTGQEHMILFDPSPEVDRIWIDGKLARRIRDLENDPSVVVLGGPREDQPKGERLFQFYRQDILNLPDK